MVWKTHCLTWNLLLHSIQTLKRLNPFIISNPMVWIKLKRHLLNPPLATTLVPQGNCLMVLPRHAVRMIVLFLPQSTGRLLVVCSQLTVHLELMFPKTLVHVHHVIMAHTKTLLRQHHAYHVRTAQVLITEALTTPVFAAVCSLHIVLVHNNSV